MRDGLDVRGFLNNFCLPLSGLKKKKIHLSLLCSFCQYDEFFTNERPVLLICSRVKS